MANPVLFRSSAAVAVVHLAALARSGFDWASSTPSHALLVATIALGLATSLWNHGVSSRAAQLVDRAAMWAGFCVDLYLSWHVPDAARWGVCCASLVAAAALYFLAKWLLRRSHAGVKAAEVAQASRTSWSKLPAADMPHVLAHVTLTTTHMLLLDAYAAL